MEFKSDAGDTHICGLCKESFSRLDLWIEHKRLPWCRLRPPLEAAQSVQTSPNGQTCPSEHPRPEVADDDCNSAVGDDDVSSVPIKRSLYPIMPPNRKRERVRSRKQESPQSVIKLEESGNKNPAFCNESSLSLSKRPRGRPKKSDSSLPADVSPTQVFSPGVAASIPCDDVPIQSCDVVGTRRPYVLPRVYSCPRCSKSFIKHSHLQRHMNKKKPCEVKDIDSQDDVSDKEEEVSVQQALTFTCGLCSEQVIGYDTLMAHHTDKHQAYYPGYCRFCGKYSDRKNKLLIHLVRHNQASIVDEVAQEVKRIRHTKIDRPTTQQAEAHVSTDLQCPTCKSKMADREELISHFNDYHATVGAEVKDADLFDILEEKSGDILKCFMCCLKFNSKASFEAHIDLHQVWSCRVEPRVNYPFSSENLSGPVSKVDQTNNNNNNDTEDVMDLRIGSKRSILSSENREIKEQVEQNCGEGVISTVKMRCWLCHCLLPGLSSWRQHVVQMHQLPLVFRCVSEECRAEYPTWNDLYEHRTEHPQRSYVCKVCNDHHPTRILLASHSQTHQVGPVSPSTCGYCQCVIHESIESHRLKCARQTVTCTECNDRVKRLHLQRHMLNHHASSRGYLCDVCDSAFLVKDRLTQHMKNVHGPRKFVCNDCGAAFKRNDKLQRHCQSRHSDLKPFLCPLQTCGRAFKRFDGLRAHIKCSHIAEALLSSTPLGNQYGCTLCGHTCMGQEPLLDHLMAHVKTTPSMVSASMSSELYGSPGVPTESNKCGSCGDCRHCLIQVDSDSLQRPPHSIQVRQGALAQSSQGAGLALPAERFTCGPCE